MKHVMQDPCMSCQFATKNLYKNISKKKKWNEKKKNIAFGRTNEMLSIYFDHLLVKSVFMFIPNL